MAALWSGSPILVVDYNIVLNNYGPGGIWVNYMAIENTSKYCQSDKQNKAKFQDCFNALMFCALSANHEPAMSTL